MTHDPTDFDKLYCEDCQEFISIRIHPTGGTIISCYCDSVHRDISGSEYYEIINSLDEPLPENEEWEFR